MRPRLTILLLGLWLVTCRAMPHVSECNFCMECHVGNTPPKKTKASGDFANRRLLEAGADQQTRISYEPEGTPEDAALSQGEDVDTGDEEEIMQEVPEGMVAADSDNSGNSRDMLEEGAVRRRRVGDGTTGSGAATGQGRRSRKKRAVVRAEAPAMPPPRGPGGPRRPSPPFYDDPNTPIELRPSSYFPAYKDMAPKWSLPNCTECYGCNTKLGLMASNTMFMNRTFVNEKGATASWLFRATTNRTANGQAVVKVYCVPIAKIKGGQSNVCTPSTILRTIQLLLALQRVADECGLDEMLPRMWADKVDAVIPGIGYHIRWYGLWMEYAPGVSVENFLHKGAPIRFSPQEVMHMFNFKLNKTRIVLGAIFDLLTSQCDRHGQNIFINEGGNVLLIDNEAALQNNWRTCGFDSILVPTTQKQEILRLSNAVVNKLVPPSFTPKGLDPQLLLDYRCYIGRKRMGTQYPAPVAKCLRKISLMTTEEVQQYFHLPNNHTAYNLLARATDMIDQGYEEAVFHGTPENAAPKRYRMQPKCCKIKFDGIRYRCAHAFKPSISVPYGNPITGREWDRPRPDPGSYVGGTITDYE